MPKPLGTILPTRASLALEEKCYQDVEKSRKEMARRLLSHLEHRRVGMEDRFYEGEDRYAMISFHALRVLWFHRRADGHWYADK